MSKEGIEPGIKIQYPFFEQYDIIQLISAQFRLSNHQNDLFCSSTEA